MEPITKAHYHMMTPKLRELQMQIKEILDLGLIRPSISSWGVLMIFVNKSMDRGDFVLIINN
jgi:hypothetical protein